MKSLGSWFIGFGLFLFLCGVAGFASNPSAAQTALITGSFFGGLAAVAGWALRRRLKGAWTGALVLCLVLLPAFIWRSTASWQATLAGEAKTFAAILITAMLVATLLSLGQLWRYRAAV